METWGAVYHLKQNPLRRSVSKGKPEKSTVLLESMGIHWAMIVKDTFIITKESKHLIKFVLKTNIWHEI